MREADIWVGLIRQTGTPLSKQSELNKGQVFGHDLLMENIRLSEGVI
jgi:hypothetical protein